MSLHYKITWLYFKIGLSIEEISMLLDSDIRKSSENRRKFRGRIVRDTPVSFVTRTVNIEKGQIYENKFVDPF